jgi:ATP-dependent Clp protease ATP-binding subunit ClpC
VAAQDETVRMEIRLPAQLAERLRRRAKFDRRSLNAQMVLLLEDGLLRSGPDPIPDVFEQFSQETRTILSLAHAAATARHSPTIGTEHLLLGFIRVSAAASPWPSLGPGLDPRHPQRSLSFRFTLMHLLLLSLYSGVDGRTERFAQPTVDPLSLTPQSKAIISLAIAEANQQGSAAVEPEHLLIAMLEEGTGIAAQVLRSAGLTTAIIRTPPEFYANETAAISPGWARLHQSTGAAQEAAASFPPPGIV